MSIYAVSALCVLGKISDHEMHCTFNV